MIDLAPGSGAAGEKPIKDQSIKARLIDAGKELFADHGFAGASVREICAAADASSTMIHHYFGSKQGLLDAIVDEFRSVTFEVPLRLIAKSPKTQEEYVLRLEMFIAETFQALVAQADVFSVIAREQKNYELTSQFHAGLAKYLSAAQGAGFIDPDLKIEMVTGLVLDRLGGQILYASSVRDRATTVLNDATYAEDWLAANSSVLIHGFAQGRSENPDTTQT